MSTGIDVEQSISNGNFKWRCWTDSLILAFGSPALILVASNILASSFPAAAQGTANQRFMVKAAGGLIVEWLQIVGLWLILCRERRSFRDLGVWRFGTSAAWVMALILAALSIGSNLRFLPRMTFESRMRSCRP